MRQRWLSDLLCCIRMFFTSNTLGMVGKYSPKSRTVRNVSRGRYLVPEAIKWRERGRRKLRKKAKTSPSFSRLLLPSRALFVLLITSGTGVRGRQFRMAVVWPTNRSKTKVPFECFPLQKGKISLETHIISLKILVNRYFDINADYFLTIVQVNPRIF